MRYVLIIVAAAFALSFVGLRVSQEWYGKGEARFGETVVQVEIAASIPTQRRGLSNRESLPDGTGMAFLFRSPAKHAIWMKDMRFAIDIVWARDGKIVDIAPNVPPPAMPEEPLPTYLPRLESDTVIELPAGFAAEHGLKIGDPVEIMRS
ncbi:DUF192 domain-containing protein [Patescibacteria group bacterium]|nr:MAG: DUF192 domain-containing protein [Patescibacteria group bacterium]